MPNDRRFLAGLLLALGCAGHANTIAPGHEGAPAAKRFLVCAPNTVIALPAELQHGAKPLREQIGSYLLFQQREVAHLGLYEAKKTWNEALARALDAGRIEDTAKLFVEALTAKHEFDALVMPSIVLHETRVTRNRGDWDGVSRRIRTINAPRSDVGHSRSISAEQVADGGIMGKLPVTSLHVMVYSRDGEKVFEGRGGLEFIYDADLAGMVETARGGYLLRRDLFQIGVLRDAIVLAFDPYLTPPVE